LNCPGFPDRLLAEMNNLKPKNVKVRIFAPPERKYSTWIGGYVLFFFVYYFYFCEINAFFSSSILAGLTTFRKIWVSADEYKEDPDIIHKKIFYSS